MWRRLIAVSILIVLLPGLAVAQNLLAGKWYGLIDQYSSDPGTRDLVVLPDGSCRWGLGQRPSEPGMAKSCAVNNSAGTIDLVTGADSLVKLTLRAQQLEGTFQLKNGTTHSIKLLRDGYPALPSGQLAQPAKDMKWNATASLVSGGGTCTWNGGTWSVAIEVKGGVLTVVNEIGNTWTLKLNKLNRDGSGRISAKSSRGIPVTFDFAAGDGPREITQTYEHCVYRWSPS